MAASKNIIVQEIGRVVTFFEIYREVGDRNIESSVRIGYNSQLAYDTAKKAIKEQLDNLVKKGIKSNENKFENVCERKREIKTELAKTSKNVSLFLRLLCNTRQI